MLRFVLTSKVLLKNGWTVYQVQSTGTRMMRARSPHQGAHLHTFPHAILGGALLRAPMDPLIRDFISIIHFPSKLTEANAQAHRPSCDALRALELCAYNANLIPRKHTHTRAQSPNACVFTKILAHTQHTKHAWRTHIKSRM